MTDTTPSRSDAYDLTGAGTADRTAAALETVPDDRPLLDVSDLSVSLGGEPILEEVSLRADPGSLVGLIGPNGAGKTTLLRAINGTIDHDSGEIRVGDRTASDCSARELGRLVATVPQSTVLSFSFSVRETVAMGRHPHISRLGSITPRDREAVEAAMTATEVKQFADRPITDVSGGERQRVILARAIAQTTPLLLLDEPTSNLDINHAIRTLELVRDVVDGGRGAIAAIHDLDLAARYCDELVLLSGGRVVDRGPPVSVLDSEAIEAAFDTRAIAGTDPVTASPRVTALIERPERPQRVHVLGTGDLARRTIVELADAGYTGSAGPLPSSDVAAETAEHRGFDVLGVAPLSAPDEATIERACAAAGRAELLVIAGAVDPANRSVLERVQGDRPDGPVSIAVERVGVHERSATTAEASSPADDGGLAEVDVDVRCSSTELCETIDDLLTEGHE